jgi:hypothetical protein
MPDALTINTQNPKPPTPICCEFCIDFNIELLGVNQQPPSTAMRDEGWMDGWMDGMDWKRFSI